MRELRELLGDMPLNTAPVPAVPMLEGALIGGLLADREAIISVADWLAPDDFSEPRGRLIYAAIVALYRRRTPPDPMLVEAELARRGQLGDVGGPGSVVALAAPPGSVPVHVPHYAEQIQAASVLRKLITVGGRIAGLGYEKRDPDALLLEAAGLLAGVAPAANDHVQSLGSAVMGVLDALDRQQKTGQAPGVPTGFPTLDQYVYGWEPGQLVILAAVTRRGKTALAQHFIEAAARTGTPVAVCSLEMEPAELARRHLARASKLGLGELRRAELGLREWDRLSEAAKDLNLPVWFLTLPRPTLTALQLSVQRLQADPDRGCGMLVVDYLQLMPPEGKASNREQEVAALSRGLKALARACHIPVIALSQFSRPAASAARPELEHLRESGALEQDANIVLALHLPDVDRPTEIELHVLKQRDGIADKKIELDWDGAHQQFTEAA
jgi:replicative DNA helicase